MWVIDGGYLPPHDEGSRSIPSLVYRIRRCWIDIGVAEHTDCYDFCARQQYVVRVACERQGLISCLSRSLLDVDAVVDARRSESQ